MWIRVSPLRFYENMLRQLCTPIGERCSIGQRIANGRTGGNSNIYTKRKFGDVEVYAEFLIPARSNSGVYLHGLYEVQVFDSYAVKQPTYIACGAIYERWINEKGVSGWPPLVNASGPPGQWQSFHIWFKGPRFEGGKKSVTRSLYEFSIMTFWCTRTRK